MTVKGQIYKDGLIYGIDIKRGPSGWLVDWFGLQTQGFVIYGRALRLQSIFIAEEDVMKTTFRCPGAIGTWMECHAIRT